MVWLLSVTFEIRPIRADRRPLAGSQFKPLDFNAEIDFVVSNFEVYNVVPQQESDKASFWIKSQMNVFT